MPQSARISQRLSPYETFDRAAWGKLRLATPLPLTLAELEELKGLNVEISLEEVEVIYLPLSRLLNLYVGATQNLYQAKKLFLGNQSAKVPYIIGIAGSVAVGKSTTARLVRALLARWPNHPKVELVTTDGFLYPNRVLEDRGILGRKGFPESYNVRKLLQFLRDVKSGVPEVTVPVYSHLEYDILPDEVQVVHQPDILIVEGLNVLQTQSGDSRAQLFVSDFFDFSIYVDAAESHIRQWYIDRFEALRKTAFQNPTSYFHRYKDLSPTEAYEVALGIWTSINGVNLHHNIAPTKYRADLILSKGQDHAVQEVHLRKL
ncbi:type I pantothenate kinase [Alicyclobacillus ferrooxydans]|uniref:Pantothenate kinase n=1 Tax=Alicyclobacillus ferrooxydans TaxID=471514 RepID=A0A0P9CGK6_9BACL|nr:type I pantothenate kinase [Alicyclobacillus ferrooxydans]KPV42158.1 pantothenate kinase [Alicyclobacillus ferrooxydans]